jgi:hypothetical protein
MRATAGHQTASIKDSRRPKTISEGQASTTIEAQVSEADEGVSAVAIEEDSVTVTEEVSVVEEAEEVSKLNLMLAMGNDLGTLTEVGTTMARRDRGTSRRRRLEILYRLTRDSFADFTPTFFFFTLQANLEDCRRAISTDPPPSPLSSALTSSRSCDVQDQYDVDSPGFHFSLPCAPASVSFA